MIPDSSFSARRKKNSACDTLASNVQFKTEENDIESGIGPASAEVSAALPPKSAETAHVVNSDSKLNSELEKKSEITQKSSVANASESNSTRQETSQQIVMESGSGANAECTVPEDAASRRNSQTSASKDPTEVVRMLSKVIQRHLLNEGEILKLAEATTATPALAISSQTQKSRFVSDQESALLQLQSLLIKAFRSGDLLSQKEIVSFLIWVHGEYYFDNVLPIGKEFMSYLSESYSSHPNAIFVSMVAEMLRFLRTFVQNFPDAVAVLLQYLNYPNEEVKTAAREGLHFAGISDPLWPFLGQRVADITRLAEAHAAASNGSKGMQLQKYLIAWINRIDKMMSDPAPKSSLATSKTKKKKGKGAQISKPNLSDSLEHLEHYLKAEHVPTGEILDITMMEMAHDISGSSADKAPTLALTLNKWIKASKAREAARLEKKSNTSEQAQRSAREEQLRAALLMPRKNAVVPAESLVNVDRQVDAGNKGGVKPTRASSPPSTRPKNISKGASRRHSKVILPRIENVPMPIEKVNPRPFSSTGRMTFDDEPYRKFSAESDVSGSLNSTATGSISSAGSKSSSRLGSATGAGKVITVDEYIAEVATSKRYHVLSAGQKARKTRNPAPAP